MKRLQSSGPLHTKINPTSCLFASLFVWNPFFRFAGALLFDEKIRRSAAPFWLGLRDVGILQIFYSRTVIQRTIVDSTAFLEHGLAEKIAVCIHTNRDPNKQEVGFIFV
jgi:hypothetical protein